MISREEHLKHLLRPITWAANSSIRARQNFVIECRGQVALVMPFLTEEELKLACEWMIKEQHNGLWD